MPYLARFEGAQILENHEVSSDEAARIAAEEVRPKLVDLGASKRQQEAVIEAMRLILIGQTKQAQTALLDGGFSPAQLEQIFPLLLSGLKEEA